MLFSRGSLRYAVEGEHPTAASLGIATSSSVSESAPQGAPDFLKALVVAGASVSFLTASVWNQHQKGTQEQSATRDSKEPSQSQTELRPS